MLALAPQARARDGHEVTGSGTHSQLSVCVRVTRGRKENWWRLSHAGVDCRGRTDKVAAVNLGPTELFIILLVVLVLFGGTKLPKLARSMGQAQTEFKRGLKEGSNPTTDDDEPTDKA